MSYEIVKSISHRKKDNKIFITSASNNLWPHTYSRWEFMSDEHNNKIDVANKELYLFHAIIGGGFKLSSSVSENWKYAENKFNEYCKDNNISIYDLWNLVDVNDGNVELLRPYYEIFKSFLEEKKEGKYYLSSNLGFINKVNKKSLNYVSIDIPSENDCRSYKKVYNDYCNISPQCKDKYKISIKEYTLDNEINNKEENKSMEL